jgi:hypothetical protein
MNGETQTRGNKMIQWSKQYRSTKKECDSHTEGSDYGEPFFLPVFTLRGGEAAPLSDCPKCGDDLRVVFTIFGGWVTGEQDLCSSCFPKYEADFYRYMDMEIGYT